MKASFLTATTKVALLSFMGVQMIGTQSVLAQSDAGNQCLAHYDKVISSVNDNLNKLGGMADPTAPDTSVGSAFSNHPGRILSSTFGAGLLAKAVTFERMGGFEYAPHTVGISTASNTSTNIGLIVGFVAGVGTWAYSSNKDDTDENNARARISEKLTASAWLNQYLQELEWSKNLLVETSSNTSNRPYLDALLTSLKISPKRKDAVLAALNAELNSGKFCDSNGVADSTDISQFVGDLYSQTSGLEGNPKTIMTGLTQLKVRDVDGYEGTFPQEQKIVGKIVSAAK